MSDVGMSSEVEMEENTEIQRAFDVHFSDFRSIWWCYRIGAWLIGIAFLWLMLEWRAFEIRVLIFGVLGYGFAVGLAATVIRWCELRARKRLIVMTEGQQEPPNRTQGWVGLLGGIALLLGMAMFLGAVSVCLSDSEAASRNAYRLEASSAAQAALMASAAEPESVRKTVEEALVKLSPSLRVCSVENLVAVPERKGTYHVEMTYNEPLYAVGTRMTQWVDAERDVSFKVRGGSWRGIRIVAAAGHPVPSVLFWDLPRRWSLEAEAAKETVFFSCLSSRCADAALFEEGSEAEKALRQILGRALAVAGQVKEDRANRRTDPMAAARLTQNQRALEMISSALGDFLREHRGQVVKALPDTLTQSFGELAEESATKARDTVDVEAVLREINRRLPIAGYTLRFSAIEVLAHAMDGQSEVYHLRVKVDQPVYTLGERMTGWVSPDNRNVRLSGLPGWRVVTLRHPAGEAFEMDLQMARPGTRNPDAIAFDEHGAPGLTVVDVVRNKGRNDLLLTAGSPAQTAWEGMLGRALGLSKAIYEDANLRRNDRSAKTRYDANRKALAAFQKELKAYAKGLVGKVSESLQGLPMPPEPRR